MCKIVQKPPISYKKNLITCFADIDAASADIVYYQGAEYLLLLSEASETQYLLDFQITL